MTVWQVGLGAERRTRHEMLARTICCAAFAYSVPPTENSTLSSTSGYTKVRSAHPSRACQRCRPPDPWYPIVADAMARGLDGAISECNRAVDFVRAIGNVANQ